MESYFVEQEGKQKILADKLMQDGYSADALHGELSQSQREQAGSIRQPKPFHFGCDRCCRKRN